MPSSGWIDQANPYGVIPHRDLRRCRRPADPASCPWSVGQVHFDFIRRAEPGFVSLEYGTPENFNAAPAPLPESHR